MSTVALRDVETTVLRRLDEAQTVFSCFDYDGTLAPLALTPNEAIPLPGTAELLRQLALLPATRVAIVTGRTITDVRARFDVPGVFYIGIHGAELRFPDGTSERAERAADVLPALRKIAQQLAREFGDEPGVLLENKDLALACHYRLAPRAVALSVERSVAAIVANHQRRGVAIVARSGHELVEVRPAGVNKGTTVCRLLRACGPNALTFYCGDDETDEDAFAALPSDAITVRVGPVAVPSAARYRVDAVADVQRLLRVITTQWRARCSAQSGTPGRVS